MAHVLVIEDEKELSALVRQELRHAGHEVDVAFDGPSGVELHAKAQPDLVVLDVMLPGFDGLEVLRRIRSVGATPVLMLTARSTELDKVLGLELGADDYLTKPFSMRELLARVSAILRRVDLIRQKSASSTADAERIEHGPLMIDVAGYDVYLNGQHVPLTATEFRLLRLLAANPGRVFSREYLLEEVWGDEVAVFDRTVDSHIQRLRKKLGEAGEMIDTVWGVGYRFHAR